MLDRLREMLDTGLELAKLIGISDIIDIAIIAFLIYHLFRFIRKSRSGQVAKAILIIIIAMSVANLLHLRVVSFLLNNAVELGLIMLAIIFQPEIRRFLERIGSGKIKELFSAETTSGEVEIAIEETVKAYVSLSKDKVGALMVFERKTMLDDVLKTGVAMDARITAELLKNLFWNKAPLHDGAVIVRNGRIIGAGCMLPMSGNVNLSRDLGMRHRAGIGISETSDAVVAIVSEETGSISVAVGGMLKRHLAPETLDRVLHNELLPQKPAGESQKFRLFQLVKVKKGGNGDGEGNKE